ncbi:MAG: lytic transglycosylase domain-containing protein [Faecalibacterium sp.]|jgi:soluble lytic murein transglycosylase|nr:lytic transglycosylase domain-containing protein [Faecalibacterium sp.]
MKARPRRLLCILLAIVILAGAVLLGNNLRRRFLYFSYPQKYDTLVTTWAQAYGLDPLLVYAFIRTESGFKSTAESNVGARGLMQITQSTFDWIKSKIAPEEAVTFDDLYNPEVNIRFGCYYLQRCLTRYESDIPTAAAAYHSGWGTVDALLKYDTYSADGVRLDLFPYSQMQNYVSKIGKAYEIYQRLYGTEGEEER